MTEYDRERRGLSAWWPALLAVVLTLALTVAVVYFTRQAPTETDSTTGSAAGIGTADPIASPATPL